MPLQEMNIRDLLDLHNTLADTPVGPKSFATKTKLNARIESIATGKNIDLASFERPKAASAVDQCMQSRAEVTEAADAASEDKKAPTGKGIGRLARELLLDPAAYPHAIIAEMVNARIVDARASANSIRWYACKMRKQGTEVPPRRCDRSASTYFEDANGPRGIETVKAINDSNR